MNVSVTATYTIHQRKCLISETSGDLISSWMLLFISLLSIVVRISFVLLASRWTCVHVGEWIRLVDEWASN